MEKSWKINVEKGEALKKHPEINPTT